ncbi:MAG TPA: hypothetical protein VG675_08350 [Bryobacteraceae bacterium]|nr:hypothetical protein [Bryobacteraceae bacterium]
MLGQQLGESKGKRIVRRVLSIDPPTVEVSFEDSGHMLGVATSGFGTYTSSVRADGSIHGDGLGAIMTAEGEMITWKGSGVGKFGAGGSISYRGMLYYHTPSQKLAALNNACGSFEFDVDQTGNTLAKVWEWK